MSSNFNYSRKRFVIPYCPSSFILESMLLSLAFACWDRTAIEHGLIRDELVLLSEWSVGYELLQRDDFSEHFLWRNDIRCNGLVFDCPGVDTSEHIKPMRAAIKKIASLISVDLQLSLSFVRNCQSKYNKDRRPCFRGSSCTSYKGIPFVLTACAAYSVAGNSITPRPMYRLCLVDARRETR